MFNASGASISNEVGAFFVAKNSGVLYFIMNGFAKKTGYSQSRLSNWKNRKTKIVMDLPISILKLLADQSGLSMTQVYDKLIAYEKDNDRSK